MYSYEDRMRAVELFIKLGKRVKATIRQLGYPTKNSLKGWCREYEQQLDLPKGYARAKPKYTQEQKQAAVEHYLGHGHCIAFTMKALGYPGRGTLAAWIGEMHTELSVQVVGRSGQAAPRPPALKHDAVIALCTREGDAESVASEFGVSRETLYNWKNQLLGAEAPASMKRHRDLSASSEREELERQLEELRRDVRRLQLEQDLLKKANELLKNGHRGAAPSPWTETPSYLH